MEPNSASWNLRDLRNGCHTSRESIEQQTAHRLIVSFRGYAAVLKEVASELPDGDEKMDILYVADRIDRTVPALEEAVRRVIPTNDSRMKRQKKYKKD
tara:strand:+ start:1400 stop:1693 length:294 start_codon:yes stop_codon:yes gene_type:complete